MGQGHIHDFNPRVATNGVFWTTPIPPESLTFDLGRVTASLRLENVSIPDTIPDVPSTVSLDMEWSGKTARVTVEDLVNGFAGNYRECRATIAWSAKEAGFSFVSDAAGTSVTRFAELGRERNGRFFQGEDLQGDD